MYAQHGSQPYAQHSGRRRETKETSSFSSEGSLNSLAATICPVLVGYLIGEVTAETAISDANPALFIAMGVFALAFVIILFSKIPEPELEAAKTSAQPQESTMESVSKALSHKNLVFGVIAIFLLCRN